MTGGWESRPAKVVADRPEPSLAGVAAMRGPKRRQGSRGLQEYSPERVNVVEAETVPVVEGHVYVLAGREDDAPPGSLTATRVKGQRRDPGDPTGAVGIVADGDASRGKTEVMRRAEVGSRTCS
jgi:hypothetical protein